MSTLFDQRRLDVRDQIEFENLFQQVEERLRLYSGKGNWTDRLDSDSGIALLQALTWNVSDLAWRHTHPLRDLLTLAPEQQNPQEGIFGRDFGPHRVLTHSAVTADDYRRALLDLHCVDFEPGESTGFLLRNALLVQQTEGQHYHYYYDPLSYRFLFLADTDPQNLEKREVLGGYQLLLQPARGVIQEEIEPHIQRFLLDNRNLCERVREITWLQPQDLQLSLDIELQDECSDPARVLAQLFTLCENFLTPEIQRYSANDLLEQGYSSADIYQGPHLQHGWIPHLKPAPDYTADYPLSLTPLVNQILAIDGVKTLRDFNAGEGGVQWQYWVKAFCYPLLWGNNPLATLAAGDRVRLFKRGQQLMATAKDIQSCLQEPELLPAGSEDKILDVGRWRDLGQYASASGLLPPGYGLQQLKSEPHQQHLHQFLLAFEQWLANGTDQLARLPELMSFVRNIDDTPQIWGGQWPFNARSVADPQSEISDLCHAEYKGQLIEEIRTQSQDEEKELALLDWLLGYFGRERAPQILENNNEYMPVQRGWLSEQGLLGYGGATLRIGEISAPIKRIAARLGVGKALFTAPEKIDLTLLPFYLIEHWALLPEMPAQQNQKIQPVKKLEDNEVSTAPSEIWLVLEDDVRLKRGQQIDLLLGKDSSEVLTNLVVREAIKQRVKLDPIENPRLATNWKNLCAAAKANNLNWRCSDLWLMEKSFPYQGVSVSNQGTDFKQIVIDPLPPTLGVGDILILKKQDAGTKTVQLAKEALLEVEITALDPVTAQLTVQAAKGTAFPKPEESYAWYPKVALQDRFSFTVSLVFNRDAFFASQRGDISASIRWVHQVVEEEIPHHLSTQIHWFNQDSFSTLGHEWAAWQNFGEPHGDRAYRLLAMLSLGELPPQQEGLGVMHVATAEELKQFADDDHLWADASYEAMKAAEVLFIPK